MESFESIYNATFPLVAFVLRKLRVPEADIEEMVQETFLRFHQNREKVEPGKEKAWLATTARNLAFDRFASDKRRKTTADSEAVARVETPLWEAEPLADARIDEVRAFIEDHVRKTGNDILALFYLEEVPVKVIAERKGMAVSSVTSSLSRQRKEFNGRLRERLEARNLA